jgi:hypothetical protein
MRVGWIVAVALFATLALAICGGRKVREEAPGPVGKMVLLPE